MGEPGAGRAGLSLGDWSARHHGIDPTRVPLLCAWLRLVWSVGRPLARWRVPPIALTVSGAVLSLDALLLAAAQPWLALTLVLAATGCDALDGAVAMLAGRTTALGARADKIADRIADTAFALVIWRAGAPFLLAAFAGALSLAHETVREIRGGALHARITVAERPTRVICASLACVCAGLSPATWPPTVCAGVWVGLAAVGLLQLAPA